MIEEQCQVIIFRCSSTRLKPSWFPQRTKNYEVCEKYKEFFYKKLQDRVFHANVMTLKGKRLGCYCFPERCHLDIIAEYLNKI